MAVDDPPTKPEPPSFPMQFTNKGFYEVQIFVKHDPLCIAQIPAMVSNGTHCYKAQEGTFNYDATVGKLRIDYLRSRIGRSKLNMTEYFYHEGTNVHPDITKYGIKLPTPLGGMCPCINVSCGIVTADGAAAVDPRAVNIAASSGVLSPLVTYPHRGLCLPAYPGCDLQPRWTRSRSSRCTSP